MVHVGFGTSQGFDLLQRQAKMLAASTLVPKEYTGQISNCAIAINMAARVGADPLMVMQNLVIVHNRPTWSSQFLISTVNSCGRFTALRYEFFGKPGTDEWGCRAWAIEKATGEKLVGTDITIKLAKDEGWYNRNGSKWKTMPQQMLMYRSGSWWTRAYAPELSMGLHTAEEIRDVLDVTKLDDGSYGVTSESLRNAHADVSEAVDPATGEVLPCLEDWLGDITAAPTAEGVDFKFSQACDAFPGDTVAHAKFALAKAERMKAFTQPAGSSGGGSGDVTAKKGLFGKTITEGAAA